MEKKKNILIDSPAKDSKIVIKKDGPYLVSGGLPLEREIAVPDSEGHPIKWVKGKKFPAVESFALCRCGSSKKLPYCDGTHSKVGFDGTETALKAPYLEQAVEIIGPELKLTDAQELCAGAGFCHGKQGDTWELTKSSDDPESKKIAIEQSCNCPSGRLIAWDKKTSKPVEPDSKQSISVTKWQGEKFFGPLWVKGRVQICSADGAKYEKRNNVTLCRCGRSKNKPFCDSSHLHDD